jgi:hypothetical protein
MRPAAHTHAPLLQTSPTAQAGVQVGALPAVPVVPALALPLPPVLAPALLLVPASGDCAPEELVTPAAAVAPAAVVDVSLGSFLCEHAAALTSTLTNTRTARWIVRRMGHRLSNACHTRAQMHS